MKRLIEAWLAFQRSQKPLFFLILAAVIGYGAAVATRSEIEAFPEFTNIQVQVITQYAGKAAEEVERLVTVPLEVATNGTPGLINQRSISIFGLSVITLTFDDNVISKDARLAVSQRIGDAELPESVKPSLSPDSTPVGEIFRYVVQGTLPSDEARLVEDWKLEREFKSIPGVADVVTFGGPIRIVEIKLDVPRIKALGLSVSTIAQALGQNSLNAGGSVITRGQESYIVRSIGLYETPSSLESAVVSTAKGVPIRVRDIGQVQIGHRPRAGQTGLNEDDDVVEGIILLRQGADSLGTCAKIRARVAKLNAGEMPAGLRVQPLYDRTTLIERSSGTVFHNIFFGIALVIAMLVVGFGIRYWPLVLGVALIIPFALLAAFVGLAWYGLKPNLISLGAVDFGIIVETAIFAAEAIIHTLQSQSRAKSAEDREADLAQTLAQTLGPALLCALLLLIAFVPILSLQRVEGRIFRPLGITLVAALIGGQIGAFVFIPALARVSPVGRGGATRLEQGFEELVAIFEKFGRRFAQVNKLGLKLGLACAALLLLFNWGLGREFLPALNEGSLYVRATAPPTISLEEANLLAEKLRLRLRRLPEVQQIVSQVGRPDDGTDVNGFDNIEMLAVLSPPNEWKTARSIDGLFAAAGRELEDIEGVDFNFSQPIKDNVDEAVSGVKGELVVKIFGPNAQQLQNAADRVAAVLRKTPGAQDVASEMLLGQPELRFNMNHDMLARYGLRVADAEDALETALLGKTATKLLDEQNRAIDVVVKPAIPDPPTKDVLASLPVFTADGAKIPLGEVSQPTVVEGVSRIYRETGERRVAVKCSVRGRAVVDFVKDASARIAAEVKLKDGYRLQWSGSFENAERASQQLLFVVPLCVIAIVVLLYSWFGSWLAVGLVLWEVPFSLVGALLFLRLFGLNLSVSAACGAIVLIGVSLLTGMMLVSEWQRVGDAWLALRDKGRGVVLSSGVAIVGLIPAALSHGIGSETAKPFAVTILGGLISSAALTLLAMPALAARATSERK